MALKQLITVKVANRRGLPLGGASVRVTDPLTGRQFLAGETRRDGTIEAVREYEEGDATALRVTVNGLGFKRARGNLVVRTVVSGQVVHGLQYLILYPLPRKRFILE